MLTSPPPPGPSRPRDRRPPRVAPVGELIEYEHPGASWPDVFDAALIVDRDGTRAAFDELFDELADDLRADHDEPRREAAENALRLAEATVRAEWAILAAPPRRRTPVC